MNNKSLDYSGKDFICAAEYYIDNETDREVEISALYLQSAKKEPECTQKESDGAPNRIMTAAVIGGVCNIFADWLFVFL